MKMQIVFLVATHSCGRKRLLPLLSNGSRKEIVRIELDLLLIYFLKYAQAI